MLPATFKVVLDANVLFGAAVRDTILRVAETGLVQVHWTAEILDECTRNLVAKRGITQAQADGLSAALLHAFPEAFVEDYQHLIASMPNAAGDRHVVAAAVHCGAEVIVSWNVSDFATLPAGKEVQTPDRFLCALCEIDPRTLVRVLTEQGQALRAKRTLVEMLDALSDSVPAFVEAISSWLGRS